MVGLQITEGNPAFFKIGDYAVMHDLPVLVISTAGDGAFCFFKPLLYEIMEEQLILW